MSPFNVKQHGDETEIESSLEGLDALGCVMLVVLFAFIAGLAVGRWMGP